MNILVEGPLWIGQWSEIVCDALKNLGHTTFLHYHNAKPLSYRFKRCFSPVQRLAGITAETQADCSNRMLLRIADPLPVDVFLSIQGKADAATIQLLRQRNPHLKVIYWFGDVFLDKAVECLSDVYDYVDQILVSYRGDCERLKRQLGPKVNYLPFGYSAKFHSLGPLTAADVKRFSSEVSFVGTMYPERDKMLAPIVRCPEIKLSVWGRSWQHSSTVHSLGRLSMVETLKVHRLAKISLNIHHHLTDNGFNMKFYEIPAVGGFQLCEWQEELERSNLADKVVTFRDSEEIIPLLEYYLSHDGERKMMSDKLCAYVRENMSYEKNLSRIL